MTADAGRDDAATSTADEGDDDEALSWGDSSDRSYVEGPVVAVPDELRDDADDADEADDDGDELPEGVISSAALVGHGVVAAILLLYAVAWLKSIGSVAPAFDSVLADWMWRIGTWFAVAAPVLWFFGTLWLVPTRAMRQRAMWFVAGIVLLIPWPFVIGKLG
ncbi:hypothetical protein [Frondihabitans australicus]|uniref:DNA polymerase III subunit gamma/tau n=1 Tax=Frondihabitans australicus TaxID=386892 RepID=A0A495ICI2_9MICO|nr:hypothetical protein [Frondihabitans australicus]RKR73629.1 hypothetical protein C8E83_0722 [Frondihabitans australicus]